MDPSAVVITPSAALCGHCFLLFLLRSSIFKLASALIQVRPVRIADVKP